MKTRVIAILLLAALALSLFAACGGNKSGLLTAEEAQKIALKDAGISARKADVHVHVTSFENIPCYNIHITLNDAEYEYFISAKDGTILQKSDEITH